MEQRLQRIYLQPYQVKRVAKQVQQVKDAKSKLGLQLKYLSRQNVHFVIIVQIVRERLMEIKKLAFLDKIEFKVILNQQYPREPPSLYFTNQNSIEIGLNPFHNYLKCVCPEWSPRISTFDIIKLVPAFVKNNLQKPNQLKGDKTLYEYFQVQRLFSYQGCQVFPVKLIKNNVNFIGMICIVGGEQIVLLQQSNNFTSSYNNTDFIQIQQIFSAQKHKTKPFRALIQVKRANKKYAIEFSSEQCEAILDVIIQKLKALQAFGKEDSSDSNSDDEIVESKKRSKQAQLQLNEDNISDVESQILILQSLVDNNPTPSTINELLSLLQKVVEFYLMKGSPRGEVYLKNLQSLMANEFTQTILASSEKTDQKQYEKKQYQSIVDYF